MLHGSHLRAPQLQTRGGLVLLDPFPTPKIPFRPRPDPPPLTPPQSDQFVVNTYADTYPAPGAYHDQHLPAPYNPGLPAPPKQVVRY